MKVLLLLLNESYRRYIAVNTGILLLGVIIYAVILALGTLSEFLALVLAWGFFLTTIWNVEYVFAPSINADSNGFDVFSRWGLILVSFLILIYGVGYIYGYWK